MFRNNFSDILHISARILLGIVLILSGVFKLLGATHFELYVFSLGIGSFDLCSLLSRLLICGEMALGLWYASGLWPKAAAWTTLAFLAGMSGFLIWRISLGDTESCHCLGDISPMTPAQSLIKNAVLLAVLTLGWKWTPKFHIKWFYVAGAAVLVSIAAFILRPPSLWWEKLGQKNFDLCESEWNKYLEEDSLLTDGSRRVVCLYSYQCKYCANCAEKISGIFRRHNIPEDAEFDIFMELYPGVEANDSSVRAFHNKHSDGRVPEFRTLDPIRFLPITNGSMPVVLLTEGRTVYREYDYHHLDEDELVRFLSR